MQKLFERNWTIADRHEEKGNYDAALIWNRLAQAQLQKDSQYAHKGIVDALKEQEKRLLTNVCQIGMV